LKKENEKGKLEKKEERKTRSWRRQQVQLSRRKEKIENEDYSLYF
jgi:hypothetical protein